MYVDAACWYHEVCLNLERTLNFVVWFVLWGVLVCPWLTPLSTWRSSGDEQKKLASKTCMCPLSSILEWISEDPYHTSSDDDTVNTKRNLLARGTPSTTGHLLRTVEVEATWSRALDQTELDTYTKLLTPNNNDFIVAKVIKRMEAKTAARAIRSSKLSTARVRVDRSNLGNEIAEPVKTGTMRHLAVQKTARCSTVNGSAAAQLWRRHMVKEC